MIMGTDVIYRTYCESVKDFKAPEVTQSFCEKPRGGLWGCRGDEWKNWCESEEYREWALKEKFFWRLSPTARVYEINTLEDFNTFYDKYYNEEIISIDYLKVKEDYDAIELTLSGFTDIKEKQFATFGIVKGVIGISAWDVPSIVVLNLDKYVVLPYEEPRMLYDILDDLPKNQTAIVLGFEELHNINIQRDISLGYGWTYISHVGRYIKRPKKKNKVLTYKNWGALINRIKKDFENTEYRGVL